MFLSFSRSASILENNLKSFYIILQVLQSVQIYNNNNTEIEDFLPVGVVINNCQQYAPSLCPNALVPGDELVSDDDILPDSDTDYVPDSAESDDQGSDESLSNLNAIRQNCTKTDKQSEVIITNSGNYENITGFVTSKEAKEQMMKTNNKNA